MRRKAVVLVVVAHDVHRAQALKACAGAYQNNRLMATEPHSSPRMKNRLYTQLAATCTKQPRLSGCKVKQHIRS